MDRDTLNRVLHGQADANIRFDDLRRLLKNIGFEERTKGSHHIFARLGISEILNLESRGSNAKPYQVKQVRNLILRYKLGQAE